MKMFGNNTIVLSEAVIGRRIVINVVVDMLAVCMGGNKESILALCPAHSGFIANAVGLLRGDLTGLERLADLEEQRPTVSLPTSVGLVLAMHQQQLRMRRGMVSEV